MAMRLITAILVLTSAATVSAQWDTVLGDALDMPETGPHWVSVRGRGIAYLLDADTGKVGGTLDISNFTPAVRPAMTRDRIYAYGSFYSRGTYGDRTSPTSRTSRTRSGGATCPSPPSPPCTGS